MSFVLWLESWMKICTLVDNKYHILFGFIWSDLILSLCHTQPSVCLPSLHPWTFLVLFPLPWQHHIQHPFSKIVSPLSTCPNHLNIPCLSLCLQNIQTELFLWWTRILCAAYHLEWLSPQCLNPSTLSISIFCSFTVNLVSFSLK